MPSALLIARDANGGVEGCVGIEAAVFDPAARRILARAETEARVREEVDTLTARGDMRYANLTAVELARNIFPELRVCALLANLAVAPRSRRTGLAAKLCQQAETVCRQWGVGSPIVLQVEEPNLAARALYESLGYRVLWSDGEATALRLMPGAVSPMSVLQKWEEDALLRPEPTTLVTMAKGEC